MRKHDARKWLHAVLDLLPVILIPAFMIYSHRHSMTEQTTFDIQYKYESNEVNSVDDLVIGNIYNYKTTGLYPSDYLIDDEYLTFKILTKVNFIDSLPVEEPLPLETLEPLVIVSISGYDTFELFHSVNNSYVCLYSMEVSEFTSDFIIQILDYSITSIPDNLFEYTDYNEIESVDVHDETSNIMYVFMDNFNNTVDKYFNMGNVFNLNGVYQWFNTNIFGGTAPAVIYSVWNIALYELVMDLLFLLYGLFMWFIDMCQHLMEKPFRSIK